MLLLVVGSSFPTGRKPNLLGVLGWNPSFFCFSRGTDQWNSFWSLWELKVLSCKMLGLLLEPFYQTGFWSLLEPSPIECQWIEAVSPRFATRIRSPRSFDPFFRLQKKDRPIVQPVETGWLFQHQNQVGHHQHLQVAWFRCRMQGCLILLLGFKGWQALGYLP